MRSRGTKSGGIKSIFINYINNNIKEYTIVIIMFLIGLVLGVIFINNAGETQREEITNYINNFVISLKNDVSIDTSLLLKETLTNNLLLALTLWFVGSTVIGVPIVYGIIVFRGFSLGYSISSIIATLGTGSGLLFTASTILLQNIIFIPCLLALAVSGMKLYKSIMKDKRRENIKVEIYRHTLFSLFMAVMLAVSALIETYVSTNLLILIINYI